MESLFLLIPIGIAFVVIAVKILFWAINNGQYDNLDTEAHRILFDEETHLNADEDKDSGATPEGDTEEGAASDRKRTGERRTP